MVQGRVKKRTHLIQLHTNDPDEGPRLISDFHPSGVPIMVIVDPPSSCYFKLNIPHGIVSLEQVWGKHTGQMTPGYHCCYCSYKRIAAMITKNSIQFNTPVSNTLLTSIDRDMPYQRQCKSVSRHRNHFPHWYRAN